MNPSLVILVLFILVILSYLLGSIKIVREGNIAIVERLGKYSRTLKSGTNFVIPVLDTVFVETTREQLLDIPPWTSITKDQVSIYADTIAYWYITDIRRAFYKVEDIENSIKNLTIDAINREFEKREVRNIMVSKAEIAEKLKKELNQAVESWGIEITKLAILEIRIRSDFLGIEKSV